jgi:multidrug resistance protein MdtO
VRWEWALLGFLRRELAPAPGRWRATLRATLSIVIGITLIMALDIPEGEFLLVSLLVCTPIDAGASLDKARLRTLGTLAGGAVGILATVLVVDKPWLFLPLQATVIGCTMFLVRTTTAPYAFLLAGIVVVMVIPVYPGTPAANVEVALWRTGLTTVGVLLAVVAQLLFWPDDPEVLLLRDLAQRVRDAERLLARLLALPPGDRLSTAEEGIAVTGVSGQLDLLKNAETRSRWLRQRHAEQIVLITLIQLLVTAARRLMRIAATGSLPGWAMPRIEWARAGCLRVQAVLAAHRGLEPMVATPAPPAPGPEASLVELEAAAALEELERAITQLPEATGFLSQGSTTTASAPRPVREPLAEQRLLTPACNLRNTEAIRFALKVALAAALCSIVLEATNKPELSTALITCVVIAQSFLGAGLRKALLRIAGAVAGSLVTLVVIVACMPSMQSLASYLVVTGVAFAISVWVITGSSRISYAGLQMGIVMALTIVQTRAPTIDLAPAVDRILGVLLGIIVMGTVDVALWPVFGDTALRRTLADALHQMSELHRVAAANDRPGVRRLALGVYRTLGDALAMHDDLAFEPAAGDSAATHAALLGAVGGVERLFLDLLALGRHRPPAIPPGLVEDIGRLDTDTAATVDRLGQRLRDGLEPGAAPEGARLDALRGVDALQGLIRLYEVVLDSLQALEDDLSVLARTCSPLTVEETAGPSPRNPRRRTPAPLPS